MNWLIGAVGGFLGGGVLGGALQPWNTSMRRWAYTLNPSELMPVAETVEALYRGVINREQYNSEMLQHGLDKIRASRVYSISENLLDIMGLITLYRRGKISEKELETRSLELKWRPEQVQDLITSTQVIPGVQDIITFAVREVYTPEVAEAFGQYQGYEAVAETAKDDLHAIGMLPEVFKKYWAAHWRLPGVEQGFEMLHRGIIPYSATSEQPLSLERLLVALDIMPAWREKLLAISYSPYTRVDVRRMHKLGILKDEDLVKAYKDLGYDDEKANNMAKFTIAYNAEPIDAELTETDKNVIKERDLSKTDVLNGYRDSLIGESDARKMLEGLGYSSDEIDYYITSVDFKREQSELESYLKFYHDAYVKGILTHNDIVDRLGELNLSGAQIDYLFSTWDLDKAAKVNKPTKAELLTFLRKKIIDLDTFKDEMMGLGYTSRYIDWYLQTV